MILLPEPHSHGSIAVEAAMTRRRSTRSFRSSPLAVEEVGQLLWAAQGLSDRRGFRTVPSAGAIYPLALYLIAAEITGWEPATLHYVPESHALEPVAVGDRRPQVMRAALGQRSLAEAPAVLAIAAAFGRMMDRYRERAERYVWMEAGGAAENVHLQAEVLGLGTVMIGAFIDPEVKAAVPLPGPEQPLLLMPLGRP